MGNNYGLNLEAQTIEQNKLEKAYMGVVSDFPELIKDHQYWLPYWNKITPETQFGARIETMNCTSFNTCNILEMLFKYQFDLDINISDRFVGKVAGTKPNGNTVDAPIDAIRKYGFLMENEWSFDRDNFDWNEYYSLIPADKLALAKTRLNDWDFKHEYVPVNPEAIMQALKTSPLGGTVSAWHKGDDGIYRTMGYPLNHWTVAILDYIEGEYWICGDTYPEDYNYGDNPQQPEFIKKLAWDYDFGCIKRYKIIDKRYNKPISFYNKIINMFKKIVRRPDGSLWFHKVVDKNGAKFTGVQKIESYLDLAGALIDEIGCETVQDKEFNKWLPYTFFGK